MRRAILNELDFGVQSWEMFELLLPGPAPCWIRARATGVGTQVRWTGFLHAVTVGFEPLNVLDCRCEESQRHSCSTFLTFRTANLEMAGKRTPLPVPTPVPTAGISDVPKIVRPARVVQSISRLRASPTTTGSSPLTRRSDHQGQTSCSRWGGRAHGGKKAKRWSTG